MSSLESHHFYKPFTATIAGFILPMVNGFISACSSALILHVIRKSQAKFSTTYHRIMALMSFFDIILSIFFSLGTIMMPSDTFYKFAGPTLGNQATCEAQGWLTTFGIAGGTSLNASLSWYFVLKITFNVKASMISRIFEPMMYLYTIGLAIAVPSFFLSKNLLNPNPYDIFCTIVPYPKSCDEEKWYDWNYCEWEENAISDFNTYVNVAVFILLFHFISIALGMSVILWSVFQHNKLMKALISSEVQSENDTDSVQEENYNENEEPLEDASNGHLYESRHKQSEMNHVKDLKYSRVLIIQALMYIFAYFLTWFFNFLSGCFNIASFGMDAANYVLFPLQGFWNLFIFLYDKTYLIRRSNNNTSFWTAAKEILFSPRDVPVVFMSNISTVVIEPRNQENDMEQDARISQIESAYDGISQFRHGFSVESANTDSIDDLLINRLERSTLPSPVLHSPESGEPVSPIDHSNHSGYGGFRRVSEFQKHRVSPAANSLQSSVSSL